jgi:hypothetical protein
MPGAAAGFRAAAGVLGAAAGGGAATFFTARFRALFAAPARFLEAGREVFLTDGLGFDVPRERRADLAAGRRAWRRDAVFFAFFAFLAAFRAVFRGAAAFLDIARLGLLAIRRSFQRSAGRD